MLVEEGLLGPAAGAAILRGLRQLESEGVVETRARVGGGLHSGEQYLIRLLGEDIGGRFHVARSSGDLSSVAINTLQREKLLALMRGVNRLRRTLIDLARGHTDTILPGYSFGQHAQPMTLAHLWLSWAANLARDFERLHGAYRRVNTSPAGAAIMVGSDFPVNRARTAELLGFDSVHENCADAILELNADDSLDDARGDRDPLPLDGEMGRRHHPVDDQRIRVRRHPGPLLRHVVDHDAEEERDRSGGGEGRVGGGAGLLRHVVPRAQRHDRPADHRALLRARHAVARRRQRGARSRAGSATCCRRSKSATEHMREQAWRHWATATDLAGALVRERDLPWRTAHQIVGILVRLCEERGLGTGRCHARAARRGGDRLPRRTRRVSISESIRAALDPRRFIAERTLRGGPALAESLRQARLFEEGLAADELRGMPASTLASKRRRGASKPGSMRSLRWERSSGSSCLPRFECA